MNPHLLLAVSQSRQQEISQTVREASAASQARGSFTFLRRFRLIAGAQRPAPAISVQARTA